MVCSFDDPLNYERLREFFATRTLEFYNLAHLGYQPIPPPFFSLHIGGALEDVDKNLSPYQIVNGGADHLLYFLQRQYGSKIQPFNFELGFLRKLSQFLKNTNGSSH